MPWHNQFVQDSRTTQAGPSGAGFCTARAPSSSKLTTMRPNLNTIVGARSNQFRPRGGIVGSRDEALTMVEGSPGVEDCLALDIPSPGSQQREQSRFHPVGNSSARCVTLGDSINP